MELSSPEDAEVVAEELDARKTSTLRAHDNPPVVRHRPDQSSAPIPPGLGREMPLRTAESATDAATCDRHVPGGVDRRPLRERRIVLRSTARSCRAPPSFIPEKLDRGDAQSGSLASRRRQRHGVVPVDIDTEHLLPPPSTQPNVRIQRLAVERRTTLGFES